MTFSIVARDPVTKRFGVAVATGTIAVGALVPYARSRIGAVATQATTNPTLGPRALDLLGQGTNADKTLYELVAGDDGRDHRQFHLIGATGAPVAWTGQTTVHWSGHEIFDHFSVAGNMLSGSEVLAAMAAAFQDNDGLALADRLLLSLQEGGRMGGDYRGCKSAALIVFSTEDYGETDLRVDLHDDPLGQMERLLEASKQDDYRQFMQSIPTRAKPHRH
jgi:uncharacterized Ntn-hydrolase superfamily protein